MCAHKAEISDTVHPYKVDKEADNLTQCVKRSYEKMALMKPSLKLKPEKIVMKPMERESSDDSWA